MKDSSLVREYDLVHDASELRELIAKHPDLPIAVIAGEEANCGEYSGMYCASVKASINEILDCAAPCNEEIVYSDKDQFEEDMTDYLACQVDENMPDAEFNRMVKAELKKYEPFWKKCICIWASN